MLRTAGGSRSISFAFLTTRFAICTAPPWASSAREPSARQTTHIARGFGMTVLFADHAPPKATGVRFTPFAQVLAAERCDSLHLPLTDETRNMIGMDELRMMKRRAILINTARAGLVD